MKILAWFSSRWYDYISNKNIALCNAIKADPDFVLAFDYTCEPQDDLDAVFMDVYGPPLPSWVCPETITLRMTGDMHRFTADSRDAYWSEVMAYDMLVTAYPFAVPQEPNRYFWPPQEARDRFVFFPNCVPDAAPTIRQDRCGGLLSGNANPLVYPWRAWVASLDLPEVTIIPHPGNADLAKMCAVRDSYFGNLSMRLASFTCNSILDYTVAKYIEIPYAGCTLIAQRPNATDAEWIGLQDGHNCLWIDGQNEKQLRDAYDMVRNGDGKGIAEAGQALVLKRHTASCRLAYIKRLVAWYQEHRRVPTSDEQRRLFMGE